MSQSHDQGATVYQEKATSPNSETVTAAFFQGPIPPPEMLEQYHALYADAPRIILEGFESQYKHRIQMETMIITSQIQREKHGQLFGFFLCIVTLVFGFILILNDKDVVGIVSIVSVLAALAGVFVIGKNMQKKELQDKDNQSQVPVAD